MFSSSLLAICISHSLSEICNCVCHRLWPLTSLSGLSMNKWTSDHCNVSKCLAQTTQLRGATSQQNEDLGMQRCEWPTRRAMYVWSKVEAFGQPLMPWKRNKYYVFWVCVCSLRYPACNAHAPCFHRRPVRLYNIFPHLMKAGFSVGEGGGGKMCV
jgi:hypothetical protein